MEATSVSVENASPKLERIRAARRANAHNLKSTASTAGAASASEPASSGISERAMPPAPALTSEMTGWPCSGCTYINVESTTTCALCSAPSHGWPDDSGDTPDDRSWDCPVCTFSNSSDHAACEMCGHRRREHGDSPYIPAGGGWACAACTLENPDSAASCAACGATRSPQHRSGSRAGSLSELTEGLSPLEAKLVEAALKLKLKDLAD